MQDKSLSQRTEEMFLASVGYESLEELKSDPKDIGYPLTTITEFKDKNKDTVLVIVSRDLSREDAKILANNVIMMGYVEGLENIHVDGPTGGANGWSTVSPKHLTP